jgi:hypothetical protein
MNSEIRQAGAADLRSLWFSFISVSLLKIYPLGLCAGLEDSDGQDKIVTKSR